MQAQKILLIIPICIGSGFLNLFAQTGVGAAGGDTSGPGGTVAYSIGQVAYTNFDGESGSVNLGVQQPYDIIMVATSEPGINLTASIYPNPTATAVRLMLDEAILSSGTHALAYGLFDVQGRLLQHKEIHDPITIVTMEQLEGSVYFLRVTRNDKEVKTFKIFKTN